MQFNTYNHRLFMRHCKSANWILQILFLWKYDGRIPKDNRQIIEKKWP